MNKNISDYVASRKIVFDTYYEKKDTGCWIWTRAKCKKGYGRFGLMYKLILAHRFSFLVYKHDPKNQMVCHTCDNPSCVNPEHLFLGGAVDNVRDMINKKRYNAYSKGHDYYYLDKPKKIDEIIKYLEGSFYTISDAAKKFNIKPYLCERWIKQKGINPKKYKGRKKKHAVDFYLNNNISMAKVSEMFGISRPTLRYELRKLRLVKFK
jgi:transposase-like protein